MKFNPATLPKNEINSGKIWTLLQFNEEFGKDVQWFSEKYKRSKNKRVKQENRDKAISELHNKFEEINSKHPLAGTALQWMFPMPIIIEEDGQGGIEHPFSWGPEIMRAKGDKVDDLAELRECEASKNWLTLKTDWRSANKGFKRNFMYQYRQFDSRPLNSVTKDRSDAPSPYETHFFNALNLSELIRKGELDGFGLDKALEADNLKEQYRVFAVPRHLHTKNAVDDAFKPLIKQIKADLPKKASDPFGTKTEWRDYLAVREIQEDGSIPFKAKAIKTLIKKRHCKDRQFLVDEVFQLNDARRVYEGDITNNYKKMASNINSIYPKFLH